VVRWQELAERRHEKIPTFKFSFPGCGRKRKDRRGRKRGEELKKKRQDDCDPKSDSNLQISWDVVTATVVMELFDIQNKKYRRHSTFITTPSPVELFVAKIKSGRPTLQSKNLLSI